jgi:hypothetical protein
MNILCGIILVPGERLEEGLRTASESASLHINHDFHNY